MSKIKPDLTGTWVLELSQSETGTTPEITLIIEHHDPEIKITRKARLSEQERTDTLNYYSDGRGEENPSLESNTLVKSKTKWNGNELVSKRSRTTRIRDDTVFVDETEAWLLSADGRTLTQKITVWLRTNTPGAAFFPDHSEQRHIYRRV